MFNDRLDNHFQNNFDSFKQQNLNQSNYFYITIYLFNFLINSCFLNTGNQNNHNERANLQNNTLKNVITNFIKGKELDL